VAARRPVPRLHVVTDDAVAAWPDFITAASAILQAGGRDLAFHLRAPAATGLTVHGLAAALLPIARACGALLLVNDRVDVAAAAGAHGAHLGRRSVAPVDARRIVGGDHLLGLSVGTPEGRGDAEAAPCDYLLAGSVFPTASHPGREPIGLRALARVAAGPLPVIAIGGVTADRIASVLGAGAYGAAVIRAVWDADEPARAVGELLRAFR
jgi:thiamine-phosphate pyrophosphorylase